jgi:Cu(I)/Ag(I) efflux system protein CusF
MISRHFHTLILGVLPLAFAACTNAGPAAAYPAAVASPPLGIDLGSSSGQMTHPAVATAANPIGEGHEILPPGGARTALVHEGHGNASATGTVNSINTAARTVNVSHGAIQAFGWPPMTMNFPVAPSVNLKAFKAGEKVDFTLDKGSDGMPLIDTMAPAGGGK